MGLASPAFTQTFESPSFTQNLLINTTFAQISSSTLYYDGNAGGGACAFYEEAGNCVTNFTSVVGSGAANVISSFSIFFNTPQTSVIFALVTGGADADTFTALLNGAAVDSFSAVTTSNYNQACISNCTGNLFGFTNIAGGFNQIQVQTTGSNLAVIDNIQLGGTGSVPEPGTIALFGLGIAGVIALRRRRAA